MKKLLIVSPLIALIAAFSFIAPKEFSEAKAADENSITFQYSEATNAWNNKVWNIPSSYLVGEVGSQVADLSTAKALSFTVDNIGGNNFTWNIGIFDSMRKVNSQDEWLSNGKGSAILIYENGDTLFAQSSIIPANFKGEVVLPLKCYLHEGNTLSSPTYNEPNNPVFGIRNSIAGNHGLYAVGDSTHLQNFPTATMDTKFTFYINTNWTHAVGKDITFNNISILKDSDYKVKLNAMADLDYQKIGSHVNETTLDNAVVFKDSNSGGKTLQYACNWQGIRKGVTTSAINISDNSAIALRVKNFQDIETKIDMKINETSASLVFATSNSYATLVHYIDLEGNETTISCFGGISIPKLFDGTIIVPLINQSSYYGVGGYDQNANGRLDGGCWLINFYTYTADSCFTIADIQAIKPSYDKVHDCKDYQYVLFGANKSSDSSLFAYPKNIDCWLGYSTITPIGDKSNIVITESMDGKPISTPYSTMSKNQIFYLETSKITIGVGSGRLLKKISVNNVDVTDKVQNIDGKHIYNLVGGSQSATTYNVAIEYYEGFYINYVLNGGIESPKGNPTLYTPANVGDNALELNNPIWANHIFLGWYNRVEFSHNDAFVIEKIDYNFLASKGYNHDNLTLYARWGNEYTINLIDVDNQTSEEIKIIIGEALTQEVTDFYLSMTGSTYELYLDEAFTNKVDLPFYGNSANINLYVKRILNKCSIKFHTLGGSFVDEVEIEYGHEIGNLPTPTYPGRVFIGWYYSEDYDTAVQSTDIVKTNFVLFARWGVEEMEDKSSTVNALIGVTCGCGVLLIAAIVVSLIFHKKKII